MKDVVITKSGIDKIKLKNPWVYRREIKNIPKGIERGELVKVLSPSGEFLAVGYINPESNITLRILSFKQEKIDREFIFNRIKNAYRMRERLFTKTNAVRIVHSEADGLPGLIVDYYGGYLSIQINTAGMERLRTHIVESLIEIFDPKAIVEKSDRKSRQVEGLPTEESVIYGEIFDSISITENFVRFEVDLKSGQKTGFYLDQRCNRKKVSDYVKGGDRVLDLFSNTGGFGIYCGIKGAEFVKFVDVSPTAVSKIEDNVTLNSLKNYEIVKADVFDFLKEELKSNYGYDLIIIDPPPFAKSRHEKSGALKGFKYLLLNSLKLLNVNGYIALFSCSHHITHQDLIEVTQDAIKDTGFLVRYLEYLTQDIDHPYIINIPSSLYLKGFVIQKLE